MYIEIYICISLESARREALLAVKLQKPLFRSYKRSYKNSLVPS